MEKLVYIYWAALAVTIGGLMLLGWLVITAAQQWSLPRALFAVIVLLLVWRPATALLSINR